MNPILLRTLTLVILLVQVGLSLASQQGAVFLGSCNGCEVHVAEDYAECDTSPGSNRFTACDHAPAPMLLPTSSHSFDMCEDHHCPCPHVHLSEDPITAQPRVKLSPVGPDLGVVFLSPVPEQVFARRVGVFESGLIAGCSLRAVRETRLLI